MADPFAPLHGLALTAGDLDRRAHMRGDPHLLARLLADPATRVVAIRGDRMAVREADRALELVTRAGGSADLARTAILLGWAVETSGGADARDDTAAADSATGGGGTAYVGVIEARSEGGESDDWQPLRAAGGRLGDRDAGIFATLLGLANWHASHGHCSRCGAATQPVAAGWVRRCPEDGSEHFPRTDPAVIVSVVDDDERLLLGRGKAWPEDQFSVLAGFVEPGESIEAAVAREVFEESGVRVDRVRYLGDQPWPFPSSLMIGATARALTTELHPDTDEMAEVRWVTRAEYAGLLASGGIRVPGGVSIARRLIERWLGDTVEAVAGRPVIEGWRPVR